MPIQLTIRDNGVAVITLDRQDAHNALDEVMLTGLGDAVSQIEVRAGELGCVLIRSEGKDFSVGGDLKSLESGTLEAGYGHQRAIQQWVRKLANLPLAVVCAVQGHAAGAGCSLALGADVLVATETSHFTMAFINVGLVPDLGGLWYLVRRVGAGGAMDLLLTGRPVEGREGYRMGLVDRLTGDEDLQVTALHLAEEIAGKPRQALQILKRAVDRVSTGGLEAAFEIEALGQEILLGSADHVRLREQFLQRGRKGHDSGG